LTREAYSQILQKLQQLEADMEKERDCHETMELEFQAEQETLNDTIAVLETKLSTSNTSNSTWGTESLIARITAESVAAATSAVMAAFSSNPALNKTAKKHALSAANYISAEAVKCCKQEKAKSISAAVRELSCEQRRGATESIWRFRSV
jgi:hypothetical protein